MRDIDDAPLPGRQLPHNIEAEMALLGAILVNPRAYDRVAGFLWPEHFALAQHRPIFEGVRRLADAGKLADAVTMKSYLTNAGALDEVGGVAYLGRLVDCAVTPTNAGEYGRLIHELRARREVIAIGDDVIARAYNWTSNEGGADGLRAAAEALRCTVGMLSVGDTSQCLPAVAPGKEASVEVAWLVKGMIPRTGMTVVYGPSGSGKSFVALDIAMAVSRGEPWRGRKTEQGAVLYLSPDGGGLFANRIVAYCQRHGVANGDHAVFSVICGINLLASGDGCDADKALRTIEHIERTYGVSIVAVVIDTASRAMPGGDENAAKDVTRLIDNLCRIGDGKRAVIAVHHSGKDLGQGMRGHSALHAAADCVLKVNDGQIKADKNRDGAAGMVGGFGLEVVEIGRDEDGEPVTSCVVIEAEAPDKPERLSDTEAIALRTIANLIATHGGPLPQGTGFPTGGSRLGIASTAVMNVLKGSLYDDRDPEPARFAWRRLRTKLQSRGLLGFYDGIVWLP